MISNFFIIDKVYRNLLKRFVKKLYMCQKRFFAQCKFFFHRKQQFNLEWKKILIMQFFVSFCVLGRPAHVQVCFLFEPLAQLLVPIG